LTKQGKRAHNLSNVYNHLGLVRDETQIKEWFSWLL
jgi:hypothetical protein